MYNTLITVSRFISKASAV